VLGYRRVALRLCVPMERGGGRRHVAGGRAASCRCTIDDALRIDCSDHHIIVQRLQFFPMLPHLPMHGQQRATASTILVSSLSSPNLVRSTCRRHDGVKRHIGVHRDNLNNANNDHPLADQNQRQTQPLNAWRCDWRLGLQCTWR
jgi:hypothetical protein